MTMTEFATYEEMRGEMEKDLIMYDKEMEKWYIVMFASVMTSASLIWWLSDIPSIMYFIMLVIIAANICFYYYQDWRIRILQCRMLTRGLITNMAIKNWTRNHGIHNDEFDSNSIRKELEEIRKYYYNDADAVWDLENRRPMV